MGLSKTEPSDSMVKGGNEKTNNEVFATERGWERDLGNGQTELLHACSGLATEMTGPKIVGITFQRKRNLSIANSDVMTIKVNFTEAIVVAVGTPQIDFQENGIGQVAAYNASKSDDNTLVFEYAVAAEGPIDNFATALSGAATIEDADSNAADQNFPAGFSAPTMTTVA